MPGKATRRGEGQGPREPGRCPGLPPRFLAEAAHLGDARARGTAVRGRQASGPSTRSERPKPNGQKQTRCASFQAPRLTVYTTTARRRPPQLRDAPRPPRATRRAAGRAGQRSEPGPPGPPGHLPPPSRPSLPATPHHSPRRFSPTVCLSLRAAGLRRRDCRLLPPKPQRVPDTWHTVGARQNR